MTRLSAVDICRIIVDDFLKSSWSCIEAIVNRARSYSAKTEKYFSFFRFEGNSRIGEPWNNSHFFLRSSVEYSNPQLTVEEVQGIIAARLLEVSGNHFCQYELRQPDAAEVAQICEEAKKPLKGKIVAYLLNTDDIEPDRYSMNPLKESIDSSGQSAFPSANVKTDSLRIDQKFAQKYEGSLICQSELERINHFMTLCGSSYTDTVDATKYDHLKSLSEVFGIDLCLPSLRMPLAMLQNEKQDGFLHGIIKEAHRDFEAIERVYNCMGRSTKNLSTLLTIPHSTKGYGSKRAVRGRLYFDGSKFKNAKVDYKTTLLYPNAIDPSDISVAKADDSFTIEGEKIVNYDFRVTPSSPQFFLYSLASPENAVIWHGIGAFGAAELLKSYTTTRVACAKGILIQSAQQTADMQVPLQFNLIPKHIWFHPVHRNIDASIGCIKDLKFLADLGMKIEHLPEDQYIRKLG